MWHYTEGHHQLRPDLADARHPDHPRAVVAVAGTPPASGLPVPLYPGFDTLGTLEYIAKSRATTTPGFVLNAKIIGKEFGLSGQGAEPGLDRGAAWRQLMASRAGSGAPGPVQAFVEKGSRLRHGKLIARLGCRR